MRRCYRECLLSHPSKTAKRGAPHVFSCVLSKAKPFGKLRAGRGAAGFLIATLFLMALSHAQDASTVALRGTVADPAGSRISGATIVLVNDATGFRYSIASDSEGRFAFELLPPGNYTA